MEARDASNSVAALGVEVLKHGFVPLRVDEYRERLLAIRRGDVPWAEVGTLVARSSQKNSMKPSHQRRSLSILITNWPTIS